MEQNKTLGEQLKINNFPFGMIDNNGNEIYCEKRNGYWSKCEFNQNNEMIYYGYSDGYIENRKPKTLIQQLGINNYSFIIIDNNGNVIYYGYSDGSWIKKEFNQNNEDIYYENSDGTIFDYKPKTLIQQLKINKFPFEIRDNNGNCIYFEKYYGYWFKREIDRNNKEIYYENSNGFIDDDRPKTL